MRAAFTVYGKPQPQGSTRAFMPKGARAPIITSANRNLKPWRQDVAIQAIRAMTHQSISDGPVNVVCGFYFTKPKSAKRNLQYKTTKPDIDKLLRSILDGITGICIRDDSQVVSCSVVKNFGDMEHAVIEVFDVDKR